MQHPDPSVPVPLAARLLLGRAAVQTIADDNGVDVLHIKGNAVDSSLRASSSVGTDIDILIPPAQTERLHRALLTHGWTVYSSFAWGSPFEHAQTYLHQTWGFLDVHRWFPGIRLDAERAFARLSSGSREVDFAGVCGRVPGTDEQAALLLLNAARGGGIDDVGAIWTDAAPERRRAIERVIDDLDARVAFSVATGTLEEHRHERDYRLWKVISEGGSRTAEWRARVRAAPTLRQAVRIVLRAPLVNVEHLTHRLGRPPTRREVVAEFFSRAAQAIRAALPRKRSSREEGR